MAQPVVNGKRLKVEVDMATVFTTREDFNKLEQSVSNLEERIDSLEKRLTLLVIGIGIAATVLSSILNAFIRLIGG